MIKSSFDKLMTRLNRKEILKNAQQTPYLVRYIIYGKKSTSKQYRGRGLYIHKLINSDYQHTHDYPWRWGRFILKGQFIELVRNESDTTIKVNKVKCFQILPLNSSRRANAHKIVNNKYVWMLFWHGKYKHHWGFWINNKKIYWREYKQLLKKNQGGFLI